MNLISAKDAPTVHSQLCMLEEYLVRHTRWILLYTYVRVWLCCMGGLWGERCVQQPVCGALVYTCYWGVRERKCTQAKCRKWYRCAVCRKLLMVWYTTYICMHTCTFVGAFCWKRTYQLTCPSTRVQCWQSDAWWRTPGVQLGSTYIHTINQQYIHVHTHHKIFNGKGFFCTSLEPYMQQPPL